MHGTTNIKFPDRTEQVLTRAGGRMEVVASLSQVHTAAAQCGLYTQKSAPVIFELPCTYKYRSYMFRSSTIIRELAMNLAKVIFILKHSVKLRRYFTECFNINMPATTESCFMFTISSPILTFPVKHSRESDLEK